jgi:RNA polymerase sigma-70 factor, ECF subfamily
VHTDAATTEQTDWPQILALYDQLLILAPTPVVALDRAIAIGECQGPATAYKRAAALAPTAAEREFLDLGGRTRRAGG